MAWNYFIDHWKTSTSVQTSCNNFLNPKLSFPLQKLNVPTQFTLRFTLTRWPVILIRQPVTKRRNELSVWLPWSSVTLCFVRQQPSSLKLFFRLRINTFFSWSEKSFCFSTKRPRFVACWFSFTLRWKKRVWIKLRSDAFLKILFKILLKRENNWI